MALKLIVGLGNPSVQYSATRHNAGFWFVDRLATSHCLAFKLEAKFSAEVCRLQDGNVDCWLCKPMTFMNESGTALRAIAGFYKIHLEDVLVVHDDLDLDPGIARLKTGGGHGGHNGLRDIILKMGEASFVRLRLGIGNVANRDAAASYVLTKPDDNSSRLIQDAIQTSLNVMPLVCAKKIQHAMNILHQKPSEKIEKV